MHGAVWEFCEMDPFEVVPKVVPFRWSAEIAVPAHYGDKFPLWAEKYFKEHWYGFARKHEVKYTSPITYEIVRKNDRDIHWSARRDCKPKVRRDRTRLDMDEEESGTGRRYKLLLDESSDERARLDLLASHGTVVVSPIREGYDGS
jgi:hypothetical protein